MVHVRTKIRHGIRDALIAGGTVAGARVFDTRVRIFQADELPAIVVKNGNEESQPLTVTAPIEVMERQLNVQVIAIVSTDNEDHAERLDDLVAQIETVVAAAQFSGGAKQIYPSAYFSEDADNGDTIVARGVTDFRARYLTSQLDPTTSI